MTGKFPIVYADFQNADADGFVRLNTNGTKADLRRLEIRLREGLQLELFDGELSAIGTVREPGSEGVWRASIDWKALFSSATEA